MFFDAYAIQIRFINSNSKVNKTTCMHVLQMNRNEKNLMLTSLYKLHKSYQYLTQLLNIKCNLNDGFKLSNQ